jgi:DNA-binding CsgD family transcriptional regulator
MFRSHVAYRAGRLADAESDAIAALDAALEGRYIFATTATAFLIDALVERGELPAAEAALARVGGEGDIFDTWMTNWLLHGRGKLRIAQGDLRGGVADLEELGRREEGYLGRNPSVYPYRSAIAVAVAGGSEHDRAIDLASEELELARAWGTPRSIGIALRTLGIVTGGDVGLRHLREAVETIEGSGARLEQAHALVELGAALRRANQRARAREPLRSGLDLAHKCGASLLAERARTELRATGARPRRYALSGLEALTASERRVAELAAQGLSNPQIAQTLFVTLNTVQGHLRHVYQKLSIGSREQLPVALEAEAPVAPSGAMGEEKTTVGQ